MRSGLIISLFATVLSLYACASARAPELQIERSGELPASGRVVPRSGLQWMDEQSRLFQILEAALVPLLQSRGLKVVKGAPSRLEAFPDHPAPLAGPSVASGRAPSSAGGAGKNAEAGSVAQGQFKPLKLKPYTTPLSDADLPASVMSVKPRDTQAILFALSQRNGRPVLRARGGIPGRLPLEMRSGDPALADYTLVCRFAEIPPERLISLSRVDLKSGESRAQAEKSRNAVNDADFVTGAGLIGGVGGIGYGKPAGPSQPSRPMYQWDPHARDKGYQGLQPNLRDPWNRESELLSPSYDWDYGPAPEYASPPRPQLAAPAAPSAPDAMPAYVDTHGKLISPRFPLQEMDDAVRAGKLPASAGPVPAATGSPEAADNTAGAYSEAPEGIYLLEMELYDLSPARKGGEPRLIWKARVSRRSAAALPDFALPQMAAEAIGKASAP